LAKKHGSPDGAPAHHLNDADVLQINRQIWGHKTRRVQAPKPNVEVIPPQPSEMGTDLSFLSVSDRQRVEAIIHRVEQQSKDQINALAKENADLRTLIQEYKQSMNEWLDSLALTSTPSSHSPVQESLASNVDDINPATGRR
jgi:hypothetical protein